MSYSRLRTLFALAPFALLAGCGGDSATGPSTPPPSPAPPPSPGAIEVTATTSGSDLDLSGYVVDRQGHRQVIDRDGTASFTGLEAGSHTILLDDVADHCDVAGGAERTVSVSAGGTARLDFEITCAELPSADVDLTGIWSGPFGGIAGPSTLTWVVLQEGDAVTVDITYSQDGGAEESSYSAEGRVSGNTITVFYLGWTDPSTGYQHRVTASASLAGGELVGSDSELMDQWSLDYTLTRQ